MWFFLMSLLLNKVLKELQFMETLMVDGVPLKGSTVMILANMRPQ